MGNIFKNKENSQVEMTETVISFKAIQRTLTNNLHSLQKVMVKDFS